ncbi:hypothetical protein HGRIS_009234 [Hohenbuehelia grisea]|uniref:Sodium/calcium exchanger membrane region domain-containing protein n=1 Tax=Hohenbuehelia grisea TaxID=104357 RepID=A0ABR3J0X3_9AGAR
MYSNDYDPYYRQQDPQASSTEPPAPPSEDYWPEPGPSSVPSRPQRPLGSPLRGLDTTTSFNAPTGEHGSGLASEYYNDALPSDTRSRFSPADDAASVQGSFRSDKPVLSMKRASRSIRQRLRVWDRIRGVHKRKVSWAQSGKAIATYSWLNGLLIFIPIAWAVHFTQESTQVSHGIVFGLCFAALIPLSKLLEYGGEQLALYCGQTLGDLIVVTLSNAVEALLAIFLLAHGELKLLQSSVIGVILLRLLLIPGTSFLTGGIHVAAQELHPHITQMNHTLLTLASLALLLPAAFFAALNKAGEDDLRASAQVSIVTDAMRGKFLKVSRGLAVILLIVYICSRYFLHDPPGEVDELHEHENAPAVFKEKAAHIEEEEPDVNPWATILMLLIAVVFMAFTAQFLVESIEPMREKLGIQEEFFGLILLPIVSFSADGILAYVYYVRYLFKSYFGTPYNPGTLAEARAIDLSIQFAIFWLPALVLIGWAVHRPLTLLFDLFEVAVLLGACFLVNYVTADSKTNWAEGAMMVAFYIMIALTAWFYPGQPEIHAMLSTTGVSQAVQDHQALLREHPGVPAYKLTGSAHAPKAKGHPVHKGHKGHKGDHHADGGHNNHAADENHGHPAADSHPAGDNHATESSHPSPTPDNGHKPEQGEKDQKHDGDEHDEHDDHDHEKDHDKHDHDLDEDDGSDKKHRWDDKWEEEDHDDGLDELAELSDKQLSQRLHTLLKLYDVLG